MNPDVAPMVFRAAALYSVIIIVALAWWWQRGDPRRVAAATIAAVFAVGPLLMLNRLAQEIGWWVFPEPAGAVAGVPADLWISWAILWGAAAGFLLPRSGGWRASVGLFGLFIGLDLIVMPLYGPTVELGTDWLVGEAVGAATILLPTMLLARWTLADRRLEGRMVLQVIGFGALTFVVLPEMVFEVTGEDWSTLIGRPLSMWIIVVIVCAPFSLVATSAVREFVERGDGTPVPLDPPRRLVTTGPYAYVANPMQVGMTGMLVGLGALAGSWPVAATAIGVAAFSAGYARMFEDEELEARYGEAWRQYRQEVRLFVPRWKPATLPPATMWVSTSCGQCRETGDFLQTLNPASVRREAAETANTSLNRITVIVNQQDGSSGLAAVAKVLERVNLGWALVGWLLRLPVLSSVLQLITDAAGGGPRVLPAGGHDPSATAVVSRER